MNMNIVEHFQTIAMNIYVYFGSYDNGPKLFRMIKCCHPPLSVLPLFSEIFIYKIPKFIHSFIHLFIHVENIYMEHND